MWNNTMAYRCEDAPAMTIPDPQTAIIEAMRWPSPEELATVRVGEPAARPVLYQVVTEALRATGLPYGRLFFAAPDATPFVICSGFVRCTTGCIQLPSEHMILTAPAPTTLTLQGQVCFFCANYPVAPAAFLVVAPIVQEGITRGVLSLGAPQLPSDPATVAAQAQSIAAAIAARLPMLPVPQQALAASLPTLAVRLLREPCVVLDAQKQILFINAPAEAALGMPSATLEGRPLAEVLRTETVAPEDGYFGSLLALDGSSKLVSYVCCPVQLPDGQRATLLPFHVLLGSESQYEERLRSAEFTGVLQTVATVNHTINNPLFGLLITAQMLESETIDLPAVSKKVRRIIECAERIKEVTELLSGVIRPARGTYAADESMLDLSGATATTSSGLPATHQDGARDGLPTGDQGGKG
jgi:PAS domain-containing protein